MLAGAAEYHHGAHGIGVVDPLEDSTISSQNAAFIALIFSAVDLNMGDVVGQFDLECTVLGHGRHSCGRKFMAGS
jgi:hypothetical protein